MNVSKQKEIAQACVEAISNSQKVYKKMSGGDWLLYAPEYFLSTMIALEIAKLKKVRVTLENSTAEALKEADAIKSIKNIKKVHKDARVNGRVDLLVWNKHNWPKGIIEVKNNCRDSKKIISDLNRIKKILEVNDVDNKKNTLKFGIFTYYYSFFKGKNKDSEARKNQREGNIEQYTKEIFNSTYNINSYSKVSSIDEDGDSWGAYSILIQPKKSKS